MVGLNKKQNGGRRKTFRRKRRKSRRRKSRRRKSRQHGGLLTREPTLKKNTTHLSKRVPSIVAKAFVGGKRKKKKFRKGSKSKTHRGKDFETRKRSKYYNSKRWKRLTGRRTMRAPLFPFV